MFEVFELRGSGQEMVKDKTRDPNFTCGVRLSGNMGEEELLLFLDMNTQ